MVNSIRFSERIFYFKAEYYHLVNFSFFFFGPIDHIYIKLPYFHRPSMEKFFKDSLY